MKKLRQKALLELIKKNVIDTQEALQEKLIAEGFDVTQATVSRDIKEMHIIKAQDSNGTARYIDSQIKPLAETIKYIDIFVNAVKSIECAMNIVVVKCHTGMAQSACMAVDNTNNQRIVGSIAGDDTVFIATRSERDAIYLSKELNEIIR